jgi:hypothetical protein
MIVTWINTTDTGGILISSWTGDEKDAYPMELLVGVDGGLVYYRGCEGEHQSMRSGQPIELSWQLFLSRSESFVVERLFDGTLFEPIRSVLRRRGQNEYSYRDPFIDAEVLYYRIMQRLQGADSETSAIIKVGVADPMEASDVILKGNAPNPFSVKTTILYETSLFSAWQMV